MMWMAPSTVASLADFNKHDRQGSKEEEAALQYASGLTNGNGSHKPWLDGGHLNWVSWDKERVKIPICLHNFSVLSLSSMSLKAQDLCFWHLLFTSSTRPGMPSG